MFSYTYKLFVEKYIIVKYHNNESCTLPMNEMIRRVHNQQKRMPDYLGFGIKGVALIFLIKNSFVKLFFPRKEFASTVAEARNSNFSFFKNLIRFHDSIFEVANVREDLVKNVPKAPYLPIDSKFEFIIIGSGPGGAISAKELKKAGFNTCIIEAGQNHIDDRIGPFTYNEMLNQYKHAGITTTLGNANISYVEGATFGGGSEINSGLYHRTPGDVLDYWKREYELIDSDTGKMEKYFSTGEKDLCISYFPEGKTPKASLKLEEGANKMGWEVQEIPRWYKYDKSKTGTGEKMTMARTYLKEYCDNGGSVYESAKVQNLKKQNGKWTVLINTVRGVQRIISNKVILSAGTIGTAQILKKSGLTRKAGKNFQMHPTIKVVAVFNEKINEEGIGVPVHQVKEFSPDFTFGCSISSKPYLRIAMLDHPAYLNIVEEKWENMAIYYSMILPEGSGSVKNLPLFKDPLVTYHLTHRDKNNLGQGLKKLCELLISAGASSLYPSIKGGPIINNANDINQLPGIINPANSSLMTVHLFSSCPIGERKDRCVADSYGKVYGHEGLFISDASMLPSAPGVNPQGTIMALAHRNIEKIIAES